MAVRMKVNIVIPMAGRGSRFANEGYVQPKPLIDVGGKVSHAWLFRGNGRGSHRKAKYWIVRTVELAFVGILPFLQSNA
jgi:hypothetical protein